MRYSFEQPMHTAIVERYCGLWKAVRCNDWWNDINMYSIYLLLDTYYHRSIIETDKNCYSIWKQCEMLIDFNDNNYKSDYFMVKSSVIDDISAVYYFHYIWHIAWWKVNNPREGLERNFLPNKIYNIVHKTAIRDETYIIQRDGILRQ